MKSKYALFSLMALILGAIAGAIVWAVLKIITLLTELIWTIIPEGIFGSSDGLLPGEHSLIYNLIICILGALIIGMFQKKNGVLPDDMEQVIDKIKATGGYPYDRLHIIAVAAIFPLIFGGALGPEAGLTGLIVGLCFWIGDSLKYRGHRLLADNDKDVLAETGVAVTLSIIFGAPLFGIIGNIEPDNNKEKYKEKILNKRGRIFIYCMGVAGSLLAMKLLGWLLETAGIESEGGLPKFSRIHDYGLSQWKWFVPLVAGGLIMALLYQTFRQITLRLGAKAAEHRIISCLVPGVCIAFAGYFFPYTIFSGEHQLGDLIEGYQSMPASTLILTAIIKMLLVNVCINFGWRGGAIFPIIFSSSSAGFALAIVFGMDGGFAAAVVVATAYAYMKRKPATAAAILLLCFPVTYLPAIIAAAVLAAKIPAPWDNREKL